jgi:hypothetical protein
MSAATATVATKRRRIASRGVAWGAVGIVIVGFALLCWNQIARTLGAPVSAELAIQDSPSDVGLPSPHGGSATIVGYGFSGVNVDLTHISTQLQWLIAGEITVKFVLTAAVILVVGVVWARTSLGRPFSRLVTVSLAVLAVMAFVLGSGLDALDSLIAQREAFEAVGSSEFGNYYYGGGFAISGLGLLFGVGIGLLATAFAIGARISRDTEGLV